MKSAGAGSILLVAIGMVGHWAWPVIVLLVIALVVMTLLYFQLRNSDPYKQLERAMQKIRDLTHSNEELKAINAQLVQRNEQLSTDIKAIHAECNELRSNFKLLKIAFDKNGETIERLANDLKAERELRDEQFMQWTRERAKHGEL